MTRRCRPGDPWGFTFLEVLVALVILQVGLVGCAGTFVTAHRLLSEAERLHRATQIAAAVVDSLLAAGASGGGVAATPWGRVRWSRDTGVVRVVAEEHSGSALLEWWIPSGEGPW